MITLKYIIFYSLLSAGQWFPNMHRGEMAYYRGTCQEALVFYRKTLGEEPYRRFEMFECHEYVNPNQASQ